MDVVDEGTLRDRMVDRLLSGGAVHQGPVADALRAVPRHLFLPGVEPAAVYEDEAIPTRWSPDGRPTSSSSQPAIVAAMLEQLGVRAGHRVLEIGTGTGWNAALLARLVDPDGAVTTLDIDAEVAEQAGRNLAAAGAGAVRVVRADGAEGCPAGAPYDRIILTAAARDLAPAWLAQLAPDGRLVLPLALRGSQRSVAFEPAGDGVLESVSIVDCGFMPLQGELAGEDPIRPLGRPGLFLLLEDPTPVDTAALLAALDTGPVVATPVDVSRREALTGLRTWLALHEPAAGDLLAQRDDGHRPMPVLVGPGGLAALAPAGPATEVQGYGSSGDALAGRLLDHVLDWAGAGRPDSSRMRIRAYPSGADVPARTTIDRPHTRFVVDWV
jgi:protein-L-isoaspartate(D-aspartate) O-methyltransferase